MTLPFLRRLPAALGLLLLSKAGLVSAAPPPPAKVDDTRDLYGTWWRGYPKEGGGPAMELKKTCPWIKGVFNAYTWAALEPKPGEFDWKYFDDKIRDYAQAGLYIQFMVWVGPHSPRWMYENGVPEVETTPTLNPHGQPHRDTYPFYLDPNYEKYYRRMIKAVADHVDTLPPELRKWIISLQTAEGTTGDEGGYKGEPLDKRYALPEPQWRAFKERTWELFAQLYQSKTPKIHLLINSGNQGQYHEWLMAHMPETWRKAGNPGHGYQLNDEVEMFTFLDPIINHRGPTGDFVRCRSEMDETFKGWFQEAPVWNMYWLNLWGLQFGIDMLQHETRIFEDRRHDEGFRFYSKYGGQKDPATSPGAWCALREGLDAADKQRFPEAKYGPGEIIKKQQGVAEAVARSNKIVADFARFGAREGDPEKGAMLIMQNRDAKKMNDVGWNIWPGNYQHLLTQYDPNGTSVGYWRVGDPEQPYGRFARGFNPAAGQNAMYFDLDDQFYGGPLAGKKPVKVRVVYFDHGHGSWVLKYDAVGSAEKVAQEVKNADSGRWKEVVLTLSDANFANRCPHETDLMLVNTSPETTLFHMVEVQR